MIIEHVKLSHTALRLICQEWGRVLLTTDHDTRLVLYRVGIPEGYLEIAGGSVRIPITPEMADELRDTGVRFYCSPDKSFEALIILEG